MGQQLSIEGDPLTYQSEKRKRSEAKSLSLDALFEEIESNHSVPVEANDEFGCNELQELAICMTDPTEATGKAIEEQLVRDLGKTLLKYDEDFFSRLRKRLALMATVNEAAQGHAYTTTVKKSKKDKNDEQEASKEEKTNHETVFSIGMLQSLLSFIVGTDTDIIQRRLILDRIAQLLERIKPLTLQQSNKEKSRGYSTHMVVNSLREFLLQMTLPPHHAPELTIRDMPGYSRQSSMALTALIRVAAARGTASDLLYVIYVLLQTTLCDAMAAKFLGSPVSNTLNTPTKRAITATTDLEFNSSQKKNPQQHLRFQRCLALPLAPGSSSCNKEQQRAKNPKDMATSVLRHVWASKATPDLTSIRRLVKQLRNTKEDAVASQMTTTNVDTLEPGLGEVWSVGQNSHGELAHGDSNARMNYKRVDRLRGLDVSQVAAGNEHTVVLTATGDVYTVGYNDNGQCGHGTLQSVSQLKKIQAPLESNNNNNADAQVLGTNCGAHQVCAYNGCEHTLVVLKDGRLLSFGYNSRGQLGHGTTDSSAVPRIVRGPLEKRRVSLVSCSYHHTIVSCHDGDAFSWGRNDSGQLGHGDTIDRKTPELITSLSGRTLTSIACGQYHTCVIATSARHDADDRPFSTDDGQLFSCGLDSYGQLGFAAAASANCVLTLSPVTMPHNVSLTMVRCGYYHTLVLTTHGCVYGFGRCDYGQLGIGHATQRVYGPKLLESIQHKIITNMSAGCYHSVLVADSGVLYVFGRNNLGQMGTGDLVDLHAPYAVDQFVGKHIVSVAAGFYHTIVLTRNYSAATMSPSTNENNNNNNKRPSVDAPPFSAASILRNNASVYANFGGEEQLQDDAILTSPLVECLSPSVDDSMEHFPIEKKPVSFRNLDVAMCLLAHMDRLIASAGRPHNAVVQNFGDNVSHSQGAKQRLYCIDASPETFELLLSLLITVFCNDPSEMTLKTPRHEDPCSPEDEASKAKKQPLSTFEYQYMLLALLRILRANVEYFLQSDLFKDTTDQASSSHSAIYESFKDNAIMQVYQSRQDSSRDASVARIRNAVCGLQHQLVLIIQAQNGTGAGSDVVQQEAATVLMVGIDLFLPQQKHQAQLLGELLVVEYEFPCRIESCRSDASVSAGGRSPAKRYLLNNLLHRLSKDEVVCKLIPSHEKLCSTVRTEALHIQETIHKLAELLVECMISHNRRGEDVPSSPIQNRGGSRVLSATLGTASTPELMRSALLAIQKHLMLWAAVPSVSTPPTMQKSESRRQEADAIALITDACVQLNSEKAAMALSSLANFAEMIFSHSLDFLSSRESVTELFGRGDTVRTSNCSDSVLDTLQDSIIGSILPSLIVSLLPFASCNPIAQRLLKHVANILKIFDVALQHVFTYHISPETRQKLASSTKLQSKCGETGDLTKLSWLQELTKSTAVLAGRLAGAIFVAEDATIFFSQPKKEKRWLHSVLLRNGLEAQCVAMIERQSNLPDRSTPNESRSELSSARRRGGPDRIDTDLSSPDFRLFCDTVRSAYCKLNRSYAIVAQQISRFGDTCVMFDFERALAYSILKQNDLILQARRFATSLTIPRRFLGLWSVIARCTTLIWRRRSAMRGSGKYEAGDVDALLLRALSTAMTLIAFRADNNDHSRSLLFVPQTVQSSSDQRTAVSGRRSRPYARLWRGAICLVRALLRWRSYYGHSRSRSSNNALQSFSSSPEVLSREAQRFAGVEDIQALLSDVVIEDADRLGRIISAVVRNYHRASWRRIGIDAFTGLLRALTTQTSLACILHSFASVRQHPSIRGHFLNGLDATSPSVVHSVEGSFVQLSHEITSIIRKMNGRARSVLGTVDAQVLLVALNSLGFSYRREDWRYLPKTQLVDELTKLISQLDALVSPDKAENKSSDYATQLMSIVDKPLKGSQSIDSTNTKQCLRAAWTLFSLLIHSLRSSIDNDLKGISMEALRPTYAAFRMLAQKALVKLNSSQSAVQDTTDDSDILDSGFHQSVGSGFQRNTTDEPRGTRDQQRRCQDIIKEPLHLKNAETGVHISADTMISCHEGNDYSTMFWLRVTKCATGHHRLVLSIGKEAKWLVILLRDSDLRIEMGLANASTRILSDRVVSKGSLVLNRWTHIGLVSEGNKLRLYVDGTLDIKSVCNAPAPGKHHIYLGKMPDGLLPLDGVRGGIEGSIDKLRYYTRALSPIHVRILCDQGAPQSAQLNDRWCSQIGAHMYLSSIGTRTRQCLLQEEWLEVQLNMLLYGTSAVQIAAIRVMCKTFPDLDPERLASIRVRSDWFIREESLQENRDDLSDCEPSNSAAALSNAISGPFDHVFIRFVLNLAGLAMWRVNPIELGLPATTDNSHREVSTIDELSTVIVETSQLLPCFVPRNVMKCYATSVNSKNSVDSNVSTVSTEDMEGLSTLAAELLGLLKSLCTRAHWRNAVCDVLRIVLTQKAPAVSASAGVALEECQQVECIDSSGYVERLAALKLLGGISDKLRPGARALVIQTHTPVAVVSTNERLALAHVVVLEGDPLIEQQDTQRQSRSGSWPKILRVNTNELKYREEHPLASQGHACLMADDFLVPNVVFPHILYQYEMSTDLLAQSCVQWFKVIDKSSTNQEATESSTTRETARVGRIHSLALSTKALYGLTSSKAWRKALSQWPMLFSHVLQLALSADVSSTFQQIDELEQRTVVLRARLFRHGGSAAVPPRAKSADPEPGPIDRAKKIFVRQFAVHYGLSEDTCNMALQENNHNIADSASWIIANIDMLVALDSVSKKAKDVSAVVEKVAQDPALIFDERYFDDVLDRQEATVKFLNKDHTDIVSLAELHEQCYQAELSLAILYSRATLLRLLNDWPSAAAATVLEEAESPRVMFNLFKLFLFRGAQFPTMEVTTNEGEVLLDSIDATMRAGAPSAVLSILTLTLQRMLDPEATPLYKTFLRVAPPELKMAQRTPRAAIDAWAEQMFSFCLSTFENVSHAPGGKLEGKWWSYRELERSDLTALLSANVEIAAWLANALMEARMPVAFEGSTFMRLSACVSSPNMSVRTMTLNLLGRIVQIWSNLIEDADNGDDGIVTLCPSQPFFEYLFGENSFPQHLRAMHSERSQLEQQQKRHCHSSYLNALSELLVQLGNLEIQYIRKESRSNDDISLESICIQRPKLVTATQNSLQVEWPKAKISLNLHVSCIYELQIVEGIEGGDRSDPESQQDDNNSSIFYRTIYRGNRTEAQVNGLVPSRNYQLRVCAQLYYQDDWHTIIGMPAQLRTQAGSVFSFDDRSCGPSIRVSNHGLTATYEGNEAWSVILVDQPLVAGCNQWEIKIEDSPTSCIFIGVATRFADVSTFLGGDEHSWGYIGDRALYHKRMKTKAYGERYNVGDIIGVTLDMNNGIMSFSKNGFDLGAAFEGLTGELYPAVAFYNRGQRVTIRAISYRCPGVGDIIPQLPRNVGIEELVEYQSLAKAIWQSSAKATKLPIKARQRAYNWFQQWCSGSVTRHSTCAGYDILIDTSKSACLAYGASPGESVQTSRGSSQIIGVASGLLWIYPEGKTTAWFLTPTEVKKLRTLGHLKQNHSQCEEANSKKVDVPIRAPPELLDPDDATIVAEIRSQKSFDDCCSIELWQHDFDAVIVRAINEIALYKDCSPWNLRPMDLIEFLQRKSHIQERIDEIARANDTPVQVLLTCRAALLYIYNEDYRKVFPFISTDASSRELDLIENEHRIPWPNLSTSMMEQPPKHEDGSKFEISNSILHKYPARTAHACDHLRSLAGATRCLVFASTKKSLVDRLMQHTMTKAKPVEDDYDYPEDLPQVALNRLMAMTGKSGKNDANTRLARSIFGQLYESLHFLAPRLLRMGYSHPMDDAQERTFKVKFEGEGVDDYGGPYREIFVQTPLELQAVTEEDSSRCNLPLLIPTSADASNFVPKPSGSRAPCQMHREMYVFLGKLIGIALRSKTTMQFDFPSRVWKALLNEQLYSEDISDISENILALVDHELNEIRRANNENTPVNMLSGLNWTTTLSDGTEVELKPGGRTMQVAVHEIKNYIKEAINARLHESRDALLAMRSGFRAVVPAPVLDVLTHDELKRCIRGVQKTDVDLLRRNTEYDDDIHPDDSHIKLFWEALHSFDEIERSAFLRFVWARDRLPANNQEFHQKFKIQSVLGDGPIKDPDTYLPKSNTCFFSLSLPKYSTVEIMQEKLRYAMSMCVEMDADFRLADNDLVRWFDPDDQ